MLHLSTMKCLMNHKTVEEVECIFPNMKMGDDDSQSMQFAFHLHKHKILPTNSVQSQNRRDHVLHHVSHMANILLLLSSPDKLSIRSIPRSDLCIDLSMRKARVHIKQSLFSSCLHIHKIQKLQNR